MSRRIEKLSGRWFSKPSAAEGSKSLNTFWAATRKDRTEDGKMAAVKVNEGGVLVGLVVGSRDRCKKYQVRKHGVGVWTCTCMAYRFTKGEIGKKFPCKHMRQLWNGPADGVQILAPQAL